MLEAAGVNIGGHRGHAVWVPTAQGCYCLLHETFRCFARSKSGTHVNARVGFGDDKQVQVG